MLKTQRQTSIIAPSEYAALLPTVEEWYKSARADHEQRDELLEELDDQAEGIAAFSTSRRWRGACELVDPLSQEAFLELWASLSQAVRRDPKFFVQAKDPLNKDGAKELQQILDDVGMEGGINEAFRDLAYNALRDMTGVICPDFIVEKRREFIADETGEAYPVYVDDVRPVIRCVDLADLYLYPSLATNAHEAIAVFERRPMTEYDLSEGVDRYGFDADAVDEIIRVGASVDMGSWRNERALTDGITDSGGYYECFLVYMKAPIRGEDGQLLERRDREEREIMLYYYPPGDRVFWASYVTDEERPYYGASIMPRPNSFTGRGMMQMLQPLQSEATANLRCTIDGMNISMSPALRVTPAFLRDYADFQIYPGAMFPGEQGEIEPIVMPQVAGAGLQLQQYLQTRAQGIAAAPGAGELSQKVRKATEINAVMAAAGAKFDLFLTNFMQALVPFAYALLQKTLRYKQGKLVSIAQLRQDFTILPNAASVTATPEAQVAVYQAILNLVRSSPLYQMQIAQGNMKMEYNLLRDTMQAYGLRGVENYLGEEPDIAQPQMGLPPGAEEMLQSGLAGSDFGGLG